MATFGKLSADDPSRAVPCLLFIPALSIFLFLVFLILGLAVGHLSFSMTKNINRNQNMANRYLDKLSAIAWAGLSMSICLIICSLRYLIEAIMYSKVQKMLIEELSPDSEKKTSRAFDNFWGALNLIQISLTYLALLIAIAKRRSSKLDNLLFLPL